MALVLKGPYDVHAQGLTEEEMIRIQTELSGSLTHSPRDPEDFHLAAGVDLAYWKEDGEERAVCCIVVIETGTGRVRETVSRDGVIRVPYIPGLLSFRELPLVLDTAADLTLEPDLYVFDGNGCLHERQMGIASQAGFFLPVPTMGIAKTYYRCSGTDYDMPEDRKGAFTEIAVDGTVRGAAYRSRQGVKPIFISPGKGIDLPSCLAVTERMLSPDSRVPIPTRLADLETHRMRSLLTGSGT